MADRLNTSIQTARFVGELPCSSDTNHVGPEIKSRGELATDDSRKANDSNDNAVPKLDDQGNPIV